MAEEERREGEEKVEMIRDQSTQNQNDAHFVMSTCIMGWGSGESWGWGGTSFAFHSPFQEIYIQRSRARKAARQGSHSLNEALAGS